jgi:hypothetical protein
VAGRVDEVELVTAVVEPHRLELDGDAPLALEVHGVEVLVAHLAGVDRAADLEHPVGQRRLAVVDVGDDRDVADARKFHALLGEEARPSLAARDAADSTPERRCDRPERHS